MRVCRVPIEVQYHNIGAFLERRYTTEKQSLYSFALIHRAHNQSIKMPIDDRRRARAQRGRTRADDVQATNLWGELREDLLGVLPQRRDRTERVSAWSTRDGRRDDVDDTLARLDWEALQLRVFGELRHRVE